MASFRFLFLLPLLVLSLNAQSTLAFNYTFSLFPHEDYPDSGNELSDGVGSVPSWGNDDFSDSSPFVGWRVGAFSIRFEFSSPLKVQTASFHFADSNGSAGVYFPYTLHLRTDSGSVNSWEPTFGSISDTMTAVPFTFDVGNITTNHLILDVQAWGEWTMMTEATFTGSAIPEPSTYAAFAGVAMLGFAVWRRRRRAVP